MPTALSFIPGLAFQERLRIRRDKTLGRPMTLEEHRSQLLERITACVGPSAARDLVGEAHLMLVCCDLHPRTLRQFWQELWVDLDLLQGELIYVPDPDIRLLRGSIIAAAQVAITGLVNDLDEPSRGASKAQ